MVEGDCHFVALSWSPLPAPMTFDEAQERMHRTSEHWRQWITLGDFPDHRWRSYLQRSALTLKGLTYAPDRAPCWPPSTTSLPETPQGERNWDYRYAWVRDSTFALWGLYTLGFDREANDFFYFIADACRDGQPLQVMYGVGGERELTEESLPHLSGYEGAWPVRIGNAAYNQQQHDVWGAVLDSVLLHARSRAQLQESFWPILKRQVEMRRRALGGARPRHLGGAGRAAALHLQQVHVLGGAGPGRPAGPHVRRAHVRREMAGPRRPDPRRHLQERRGPAGGVRAAVRVRRPRRVPAAPAAPAFPARRRIPGSGPRCWPSPTS